MEFKGTETELHAVTYAGIVFIQDSEFYEDSEKCNVLDAHHVGLIQAEANGLLFSKALKMWELLGDISGALTMKGDSDFLLLIDEIDLLRKQATEI